MTTKRIMVIGTDPAVTRLTMSVCDELGFEVLAFSDALDALIQATKDTPDLILFDAEDAVLGPFELTEVIARDPRLAYVALMAVVDETDGESIRKYGAQGYPILLKAADHVSSLRAELHRLLKLPVHAAGFQQSGRRRNDRAKGAA